jgi:hypothetical protein
MRLLSVPGLLFCAATLLAQVTPVPPAPGVDVIADPEINRLTDTELQLQQQANLLSPDRPEDAARLRANLEQQIKTCTDLFRRNTESHFALQCKNAAEQRLAELTGKARDEETRKQKGEESLSSVWGSLARRDLAAAVTALASARMLLPNDPRVAIAGRAVDRANWVQRIRGYSLIGLFVLVTGGLLAFLRGLRKQKQPILNILSGPLMGRQFPLDQEVVHIGAIRGDADHKNDLVIEDETKRISRFHCYIAKRKEKYYVVDKNTHNGTFVNGRRIGGGLEVPIRKGDRLDLAHVCVIEFKLVKNQ